MGKAGRWYVVGILAVLYIFSVIDRFVLSLLVEPLKTDLHLTDTQIGLLMGPAFVFFYAGLGVPVAWLLDRWNRVWVTAAGVLIWSLSTIGSGFAENFGTLILLRMNLAMGEAVLTPAAVSFIADLFERHERSTPTATFVSTGGLGSLATYALGATTIALIHGGALSGWPVIGAMAEWRATLIFIGLPSVVLGLVFLFTVRNPPRGRADRLSPVTPIETSSGVFETKAHAVKFYALFFLGTAMLTLTVTAVMGWYPSYLVRTFGVTVPQAGYLISPALVFSTTCSFLIPVIAERIARRGRADALIPMQFGVVTVGFVFMCLSMMQSELRIAIILMIIGFGLVASTNGFASIVVGLTAPPAFRARIIAIGLACITGIGLGGGPFVVGYMTEHLFSHTLGTSLLVLMTVTGPLSSILLFLSWRPYRAAMSRTMVRTGGAAV